MRITAIGTAAISTIGATVRTYSGWWMACGKWCIHSLPADRWDNPT